MTFVRPFTGSISLLQCVPSNDCSAAAAVPSQHCAVMREENIRNIFGVGGFPRLLMQIPILCRHRGAGTASRLPVGLRTYSKSLPIPQVKGVYSKCTAPMCTAPSRVHGEWCLVQKEQTYSKTQPGTNQACPSFTQSTCHELTQRKGVGNICTSMSIVIASGMMTCCHDDSTVGRQAAVAALDVHELLHANVRAKARLCTMHQHYHLYRYCTYHSVGRACGHVNTHPATMAVQTAWLAGVKIRTSASYSGRIFARTTKQIY